MTSGVLADSVVSRSWFSATAPPTSAPAGSVERSRSIVAPIALDGRVGVRDDLHERACRRRRASRGMTWAMPGSALAIAATRRGVGLGR